MERRTSTSPLYLAAGFSNIIFYLSGWFFSYLTHPKLSCKSIREIRYREGHKHATPNVFFRFFLSRQWREPQGNLPPLICRGAHCAPVFPVLPFTIPCHGYDGRTMFAPTWGFICGIKTSGPAGPPSLRKRAGNVGLCPALFVKRVPSADGGCF